MMQCHKCTDTAGWASRTSLHSAASQSKVFQENLAKPVMTMEE